MSLLEKLQEDMKTALKAGEKDRLMVIRMLLSDVKNIDLAPKPITAEQTVEAYGKKLRKTIEEYEKLGKPEEVAKLKTELAVVETYLPKKASEAQTAEWVHAFLSAGTYNAKQTGQATGAFMKQHGAKVDPGLASRLIKERLVTTGQS